MSIRKLMSRILERNTTSIEHNEWRKLADICSFICDNYVDIKEELEQIKQFLDMAEICGAAYLQRSMVSMHIRNYNNKRELIKLTILLNKLENFKKGSSVEFCQNVDFLHIDTVVLKENEKENVVRFVWDVKKVFHYILYQLGRIKNEKNTYKQVAILKGMIAYY